MKSMTPLMSAQFVRIIIPFWFAHPLDDITIKAYPFNPYATANIRDIFIKITATTTMGTYSLVGIVFAIKRRLQRSVLQPRLHLLASHLVAHLPRRVLNSPIISLIFVFVLVKSFLALSNLFKQVWFFSSFIT